MCTISFLTQRLGSSAGLNFFGQISVLWSMDKWWSKFNRYCSHSQNWYCMNVSGHGIGPSADHKNALFHSFARWSCEAIFFLCFVADRVKYWAWIFCFFFLITLLPILIHAFNDSFMQCFILMLFIFQISLLPSRSSPSPCRSSSSSALVMQRRMTRWTSVSSVRPDLSLCCLSSSFRSCSSQLVRL